jgi:hypothetical protein
MSVPESIAWLESQHDASPAASIYSVTLLGELKRLSNALDMCAREVEHREALRQDAVRAHRALETAFDALETKASAARDEWDAARTALETRLKDTTEQLRFAEGVLKDIHFGLLKQPELTREDLASAIESAVTPWPEGAKA